MEAAGWQVIASTDDPVEWLDDLIDLLTVNVIVVAPSYLYGEVDHSLEVQKCIELKPTYLGLEESMWLEMTLEPEEATDAR